MSTAQEVLDGLRWQSDQIVTNHFGERVWLKRIEGGITDCCHIESPCDHHKRLTHPAPAKVQ